MRFKKRRGLPKSEKVNVPARAGSAPSVQGVPAYCQQCGALSVVPGIFGGNGAITLTNCGTRCRNCGGVADMLDGSFVMENNAFTLLSGPKFTEDALKLLSGIIERAVRKEITPVELERQVSEIDREFGAIVGDAVRSRRGIGFAFLVLMLVFLKGCHYNVDAKVDLNTLWNQIVSLKRGVIYDPSKVDHQVEKVNQDKASGNSRPATK